MCINRLKSTEPGNGSRWSKDVKVMQREVKISRRLLFISIDRFFTHTVNANNYLKNKQRGTVRKR